MPALQIRVLAKNDIQEIVEYYDRVSPKITDHFLEDLYTDLELLQSNPGLFQLKYRETRVRYMKKFPFGVHYMVKEDTVIVLAVLHTSRNPKIWEKR